MHDDALDYFRPPNDETLGLIRLSASDAGLTEIAFVMEEDEPARPNTHTAQACTQLAEYFAGSRRTFELPLAPKGTDFQRRVWQALAGIPYGETRCYAEIAEQLGCKGGQRAVSDPRTPLTQSGRVSFQCQGIRVLRSSSSASVGNVSNTNCRYS